MNRSVGSEMYRYNSYTLKDFHRKGICDACEQGKKGLYLFPTQSGVVKFCPSCLKKSVTAKSTPKGSLLSEVKVYAEKINRPELYLKPDIHIYAYNYASFVIACSQWGDDTVRAEANRFFSTNSRDGVKELVRSQNLERTVILRSGELKKLAPADGVDKKLFKIKEVEPYSQRELQGTALDVIVNRVIHTLNLYLSTLQSTQPTEVICKKCGSTETAELRGIVKVARCHNNTCTSFKNNLAIELNSSGLATYSAI